MQFASAITEYILPGLPVTAVLIYGLASLMGWHLDKLGTQPGLAVTLALVVPLLGVAYMVGVVVHYAARWVLLDWYTDQERKAWGRFGPCCQPKLGLLGPSIEDELRTLGSDSLGEDVPEWKRKLIHFLRGCIVGRVKNQEDDGLSGWILWRMRMFLSNHAPTSAQEVLHLQAVSRAARGAFALPLSLLTWAVVDFGNGLGLPGPFSSPKSWHWGPPTALLVLGFILLWVVRKTYTYRWGVVCRSTVAAFLSV